VLCPRAHSQRRHWHARTHAIRQRHYWVAVGADPNSQHARTRSITRANDKQLSDRSGGEGEGEGRSPKRAERASRSDAACGSW
jgi:hypothetical protein